MIICVCSFSESGKEWEKVLKFQIPDVNWLVKAEGESISKWTKEQFEKRLPILFVGSAGIAVRKIAPLVNDKFTDSPVMVMDEGGRHLIPILSGHMGGANELAVMIAGKIGAIPVITTSTDVHNVFSVDVFAKKNSLRIINREAVKKVAEKLISNKEICIKIPKGFDIGEEILPESVIIADSEENVAADVEIFLTAGEAAKAYENQKTEGNTLFLVPRNYCLGIGCKKGKSFEDLNEFLKSSLKSEYIDNIAAIASVDLKKGEMGIMNLAQYYHVDFKTFTSEELEKISLENGEEFSSSDFVKDVTGVDNVCERAAVACAEAMGQKQKPCLVVKKIAKDGMTLALAERIPKICTWETKQADL